MSERLHKLAGFARPLRTRLLAIIALAVFSAGTAVAAANVTYTVNIVDDGVAQEVRTVKTNAQDILEQFNIEIAPEDRVDTSSFTGADGSKIVISRVHAVTVVSKGEKIAVRAAGTAEDAVDAAGIVLTSRDNLDCRADAPLTEGMTIRVLYGHTVSITADGVTSTYDVQGDTVAEAIQGAGIVLGPDDETYPAADTVLTDGMSITVGRVTYQERSVENEAIPYQTIEKSTDSLYEGETKIETAGKDGVRNVVYRDKIVNGEIAESTVVSEEVLQEPVSQVKLVGTKKKYADIKLKSNTPISGFATPDWLEFDENGQPINYKGIIEGRAAAYTGGGHTATGKVAQPGYVAVNPNQIPYGTELYIVSLDGSYVYGYCIAADTGGFASEGYFTVDLYMNTVSQCYQWGSRMVRIYVL
ncbi:MAG TPA: G5 domain-containing protein [Candidatus Onthovicinus excrementipullorum]|nr:G5 domain-containing protein [Candidatus Onthovicinus excrementipullorum]